MRLSALTLALVHMMARAAYADAPDAVARKEYAIAFQVKEQAVVAAKVYRLPKNPDTPGFVVGRHRGASGKWTYPGVAIYAKCALQWCLYRVHLGLATSELAPLVAVDLEAPLTHVPLTQPSWQTLTFDEPKAKLAWPAILITSQTQAKPRQSRWQLVSLRIPTKPHPVAEGVIEERWDDDDTPGGPRRPSYARVGKRTLSITFERNSSGMLMTTSELDVDSPHSMCMKSKPFVVIHIFDGTNFRDQDPLASSHVGCH